jgi:nucleoside-diphosphate-sugar epimerase
MELAEMIRQVVGRKTEIVTTPTDDNRSYHISSEKIRRELGYAPVRTIADAARDLVDNFSAGRIPDPMSNIRYYNIKMMQSIHLS